MNETRGEVGAIFSNEKQIGGFFNWVIEPKLFKAGISSQGYNEFKCNVNVADIQSWWLFNFENYCTFKFYWSRGSKLYLLGEWKSYLPDLMRRKADGKKYDLPIKVELEVT